MWRLTICCSRTLLSRFRPQNPEEKLFVWHTLTSSSLKNGNKASPFVGFKKLARSLQDTVQHLTCTHGLYSLKVSSFCLISEGWGGRGGLQQFCLKFQSSLHFSHRIWAWCCFLCCCLWTVSVTAMRTVFCSAWNCCSSPEEKQEEGLKLKYTYIVLLCWKVLGTGCCLQRYRLISAFFNSFLQFSSAFHFKLGFCRLCCVHEIPSPDWNLPLFPAVLTVHVVGVGVFKFVHRLDTLWLLCRTACGVSF